MEVRYLGFEQQQNERSYRFDVVEKGEQSRHFIVTADLSLFHTHGVMIQEGPSLCAARLLADLESSSAAACELTAADFRAFLDARSTAEARRAQMRKVPRRRPLPAEERFS